MKGCDISHNQGTVDFEELAKAVDFVYIKATEGNGYVDPKLNENTTNAGRVGLKYGWYHFGTLNNPTNHIEDAKQEAIFFVSKIKQFPAAEMPLVLDLETNKSNLPKIKVLQWINAFYSELAAQGYADYAFYSYTPFMDANLPANHGLGSIKLWVASYTKKLKLPKGWAKEWMWQYSSIGKLPGVTMNVDLDIQQ